MRVQDRWFEYAWQGYSRLQRLKPDRAVGVRRGWSPRPPVEPLAPLHL